MGQTPHTTPTIHSKKNPHKKHLQRQILQPPIRRNPDKRLHQNDPKHPNRHRTPTRPHNHRNQLEKVRTTPHLHRTHRPILQQPPRPTRIQIPKIPTHHTQLPLPPRMRPNKPLRHDTTLHPHNRTQTLHQRPNPTHNHNPRTPSHNRRNRRTILPHRRPHPTIQQIPSNTKPQSHIRRQTRHIQIPKHGPSHRRRPKNNQKTLTPQKPQNNQTQNTPHHTPPKTKTPINPPQPLSSPHPHILLLRNTLHKNNRSSLTNKQINRRTIHSRTHNNRTPTPINNNPRHQIILHT